MKQYLQMVKDIITDGSNKGDRTGTGTKSLFGYQMRFDLNKGFPLVTTKDVNFNSIAHELLWFLSGSTNIKYLNDNGVNIWNEWADDDGDLGDIYGKQWRDWGGTDESKGTDQIANVIREIVGNPDSRRLIVSSWNVSDIPTMRLPCCHILFQFYVVDGKLSCQLYQRSADAFLGVPYNIASYALLTHIIAQQCNLAVGDFIWTGGDVHLYKNHIDQCLTQLTREPKPLPYLMLNHRLGLHNYTIGDIKLSDYNPHPKIYAPVAV